MDQILTSWLVWISITSSVGLCLRWRWLLRNTSISAPPTSAWTITALNAMHHPAGTDMKTGLLARVCKESGTDGCHGDTGRWRERSAHGGWHGTSCAVLRGSLSLCLFTRLLGLLSYIDQGDGDSNCEDVLQSARMCVCEERQREGGELRYQHRGSEHQCPWNI